MARENQSKRQMLSGYYEPRKKLSEIFDAYKGGKKRPSTTQPNGVTPANPEELDREIFDAYKGGIKRPSTTQPNGVTPANPEELDREIDEEYNSVRDQLTGGGSAAKPNGGVNGGSSGSASSGKKPSEIYDEYSAKEREAEAKAVEAGRLAEQHAYDLARMGAGGAGTSYAVSAGSRAYNDAYEGSMAASREATEMERQQAAAEQEATRVAMNDTLEVMVGLYESGAWDEEQLRAYASMQGFDEAETKQLVGAVIDTGAATSVEELGYDETAAREVFGMLTTTDEDGNPFYDGTNRESVKKTLMYATGYDEATVDAALDMYADVVSGSKQDAGNLMKDALATDTVYDAYEVATQYMTGDKAVSAEEWEEMDDNERSAYVLEAMGVNAKMDPSAAPAFEEACKKEIQKEVEWMREIQGAMRLSKREDIFKEMADVASGIMYFADEGYLSEEVRDRLLNVLMLGSPRKISEMANLTYKERNSFSKEQWNTLTMLYKISGSEDRNSMEKDMDDEYERVLKNLK